MYMSFIKVHGAQTSALTSKITSSPRINFFAGGFRSDITHVFDFHVYLYSAIWAGNLILRIKSAILSEGHIRLYCIKRMFKY